MRRLAFVALLLTACFNPDEPPCSFACGPSGACPDDYSCQADGYCHKTGDTAACGFSDAAMPDIVEPPDLGVTDGNPPDLTPVDGNPPRDMTQVD